ncbi:hypothetical protein [Cytobacillus sp. NCCP-133]|uniref:hypothetical protein n=1 Tax=Cytobacillus sp. NCCP-133 TaxID=766848 RepID=UPI002231A8CF|nr:hypothetical protein [Cytobacillus sp. NCCP-133]
MEQYRGFFITLALMLIIVLVNKYFNRWVKAIIAAYYLVVSSVFISMKDKIDKQDENIRRYLMLIGIKIPDGLIQSQITYFFPLSGSFFSFTSNGLLILKARRQRCSFS